MRHIIVLLIVAGLAFPQWGCTQRMRRYAGSMGAVGAVVGGTTGSLTSSSVNAGEGALMGATGGGFVGAMMADKFDETDWDGMEAEIAQLRADNETMLAQAAARDAQLAERDRMLAQTEAERTEAAGRLSALNDKVAELEAQNARFAADVVDIEAELVANQSALKEKADELAALQDKLGSDIEVGSQDGGITLTILDELLFAPGQANLESSGHEVLARAANVIRQQFPNRSLIIEGHTDDQPITLSSWKSNWELGSARSLSVLHYLEGNEMFASERLSAVSYGPTRPAVSNATPEGQANNRRAVIVILPEKAERTQGVHTASNTPVFNFHDAPDEGLLTP